MKVFLNSLYGRVGLVFLGLLLASSLLQFIVGIKTAAKYAQESDQILYRVLAHDLARNFQPDLRQGLQVGVMEPLIQKMMVFNPRVEIYLLNGKGQVLSYFSEKKQPQHLLVNLQPIQSFLKGRDGQWPILGDDPKNPGLKKPFSVARINIGDEAGYLYLILGGESYDSAAAMVADSYIIRSAVIQLALVFVLMSAVGLLVFFLMSGRLRNMMSVVRLFEKGDYQARIRDNSADEIGKLSRAFNDMADKVIAHIEEIERSDNQRRELVANISHDLRSPLSSIQGYLETLMMKKNLKPEQREKFLRIIFSNTTRLTKLVSELFELSSLEANQVKPRLEAFSLTDLVSDVLMQFRPKSNSDQIELVFEDPGPLPLVFADIGMIERVLANLLDNAFRYSAQGDSVTVCLHPGETSIEVVVSDTGIGISVEDQPRIFDRFFRGNRARSSDAGGSGLGLAITKRILDLHHSSIQVQGAPDEGASFSFLLSYPPMAKAG